jgi:molecular chaperone HscB
MRLGLEDDHFALFGLSAAFDLDEAALASSYRELQRAAHPDRYAGGSAQERRISVQRAAQINEAFQTLRDPLRRARYLLTFHGVDTREESNTIVDPAFLGEQMTLREALMDLRESAEPQRELRRIAADIATRLHDMTLMLREQLRQPSRESLPQAGDTVRKMQFLKRLEQEATELEEELASNDT